MKTILVLLIMAATTAGFSQDSAKMLYLPYRIIQGRYCDLSAIYSWIDQTTSLARHRQQGDAVSFVNPNTIMSPGWIGVSAPEIGQLNNVYGFVENYEIGQVTDDGVIVRKKAANPFDGSYEYGNPLFLTNYPGYKELTDNTTIQFLALKTGVYKYTDTEGASRNIPFYDCGTPYIAKALTPDQLSSINAKRAADKRKAEQAQEKTFRLLESRATNGDASAQFSLGIHYLSGYGCETNRETGLYWLQKAAEQGSVDASNKQESLNVSVK